MKNDLPISPNKKFKYSITFESWDDESLEIGQTDVRGYIEQDETDTIGNILYEANTTYGIYMPFAFGRWESTYPDEDADYFEKGIRKFYFLEITNEDGTQISNDESDFITFLLTDGRYKLDKFRDFAVGGIVLGSIVFGVGALITYFYFKDKKPTENKVKKLTKEGDVKSSSGRAKSITHNINGFDRKFPIKDAWRKEHKLENKQQKFEVPQGDRQPVKYEMGGDASEHYHEVEYGEGGVARAKDVIINKIGFNESSADYLVSQSEKFAIWLADSILKKEMQLSYGGTYEDKDNTFGGGYIKVDNDKIAKKGIIEWQKNQPNWIRSRYSNEIRQILDWLQHPVTEKQDLRNLSFDEALEKAREWHNELQVLGGDIDFTEPETNTIIKKYPKNSDGIEYYWVFIPSNYCDLESSRMGHCGRTGYGNNLISLRSVKPYGKGHTISDSHVTIAYGVGDGVFYQIKGKKNNKPAEKYFPYIFDLIKIAISDSINYLKGTTKFDENNKLTKEERVLEFNGFGSEYGDSEDYGFEDMTNEELRELYELKPSIFNDTESILAIYDAGIITDEEIQKEYDVNSPNSIFSSFGNQVKLYERGIILNKPSTIFEVQKDCEDVKDLLSVDRDFRDDIIENVLCGDTYELVDGFSYYYDNPSDLVNNLNKENTEEVINEIVRLTDLDKSVVTENGIKYYLQGEDEEFDTDTFDNIIRALANAQNDADNNDYSTYLYDNLKSALEELGTVHSLNDEGVKMTIDLSNLMSDDEISDNMERYEFEDVSDLFSELLAENSVDLPSYNIDSRYSPYGSNEDFNDNFDIDNYSKGGTLRPKTINSNKNTKIKNMKPNLKKMEQGGDLGVSKEDYFIVVKNWVYFTFNYPMGFVKDVFDSEHLQGKFLSAYDKYGSMGVLPIFWANLDGNNRRILSLWVKNNYFNEIGSKSKLQSISDDDYVAIINHWNMFCLNFPYRFVSQVFLGNTSHYEQKWSRANERGGSAGAVNVFFTELDGGNQRLLTDFASDIKKFADGGDTEMNENANLGYQLYHSYETIEEAKKVADKWKIQHPEFKVIVTESNDDKRPYNVLMTLGIDMGKRVYADGGEADNKTIKNIRKKRPKTRQPKMVRQYFEDKAYAYADGGEIKEWEDSMKKKKDMEFLRIQKTEALPNNEILIYYAYNPIGKDEFKGTQISTDVIKYANGGRVTSRSGIIEAFLTSNKQLTVGNLSTHFNEYDNQMLLRNYGTLIATRKGNDVEITDAKYSQTTSRITNELNSMAMKKGMNVTYVSKFEEGGEAGKTIRDNYDTLVGRIGDEYYFLDEIFKYNDGFKGATGTVVMPVSKEYYEYATSEDGILERYMDAMGEDEWISTLGLDREDFEDEDDLTKAIENGIWQLYYVGELNPFEEVDSDLEEQMRALPQFASSEEFPIFEIIGGGRIFDKEREFDEIYNQELFDKIKEIEEFAKGGQAGKKTLKNKIKKKDPKIVRQYFEDRPYSYAKGGEVDILKLYQKDTFSDKDSELIEGAIENGDIDTTDIKEDFMGYVYDRIDKEYKDEFETEDIWEYTDEQYENLLTHKENYQKLIAYLKDEDEYAEGGEAGMKFYVIDAKNGKLLSKGFDTEEEANKEMYEIFDKSDDKLKKPFLATVKRKYEEGGEMQEEKFRYKDFYQSQGGIKFKTEEEAERFIKITKPFVRKQLREGNFVLVFNGKEYFIGEKIKINDEYADGGVTEMTKGFYKGYSKFKDKIIIPLGVSASQNGLDRYDMPKTTVGVGFILAKKMKKMSYQTFDLAIKDDEIVLLLTPLGQRTIKVNVELKNYTFDFVINAVKESLKEYLSKKKFADGGSADLQYSDILNVLKTKIEDSIDEMPIDYENASNFTGEEVEHESRSGFIPYTDGGYQAVWFEYIGGLVGAGRNLPTKPLDDEMERQNNYNIELAKDWFVDEYPEIVEELGVENIDYHSLYEAGYGEQAEELSEQEMQYDGEDTIMMQVSAYYYSPENSRGVEGKHTIRLFGDVNLESPYHRAGNLDDTYEVEFSFNSISELEQKMDEGIKKIISWFDGDMYNESTTEMKVRRMEEGGEADDEDEDDDDDDDYAKGGSVKGIKKKAEKLLEESINYRWVNTDMGSGWEYKLESPLNRSVFNVLEEHTYLDEFSPDDEGIEDYDDLSKEEQDYYYEDWKETLFQNTFEAFKEKCAKHLDDFIEYIQQEKEYQDEMNEYEKGGETKELEGEKLLHKIYNSQVDWEEKGKETGYFPYKEKSALLEGKNTYIIRQKNTNGLFSNYNYVIYSKKGEKFNTDFDYLGSADKLAGESNYKEYPLNLSSYKGTKIISAVKKENQTGQYAKGGKLSEKSTKKPIRKKPQPRMVRQYFEDKPYSYAKGGGVNSNYGKYGDDNSNLVNFDIDNLDDFETTQYQNFSKSMSKAEALQVLINSIEGDYSQLSEELREIAEEQMPMDEYAKGGEASSVIKNLIKKYEKEYGYKPSKEELNTLYTNGELSLTDKEENELIKYFDEYAEGGEVQDWMEEALQSLIEETGNENLDITMVSNRGNEFFATNDMEEYRVFKSEDDAEQVAVEQVRDDMEESPENFNKDFIAGYIDGRDFFEQSLNEMNRSYADDIASESDRKYGNRLIAEMVDNGLIDEDDAESDNADELAEEHIEDFVTLMTEGQLNEGGNGLDYFISNFGEEETMKMVIDNNLIDIDEASRDAVQTDGIGHFLSSYDGETLYLSDDYVAYRIN